MLMKQFRKNCQTLKKRKGVCAHYAVVFNDLARGNSVLYYRRVHQTVRKVSSLAHAWTAAKINNKWYVFDPTWGAGYVNNGKSLKIEQ
jgi:transglutaminase/protease-like cytokinesis protein 3